jgi:hypothetical protein
MSSSRAMATLLSFKTSAVVMDQADSSILFKMMDGTSIKTAGTYCDGSANSPGQMGGLAR